MFGVSFNLYKSQVWLTGWVELNLTAGSRLNPLGGTMRQIPAFEASGAILQVGGWVLVEDKFFGAWWRVPGDVL